MHHLRALRPHQWVKNGFVFAALVFSRNLTRLDAVVDSLLVFAAFSLLASSIYLVNDCADVERDRHHPEKRNRPIASGKVKVSTALLMAAVLGPAGLAIAYGLNAPTGAALSVYAVLNLSYSFRLKHVVLLDVFIIAIGFLIRVTAGALAIEVPISPWLVICTFFIALFLAFCKRRHELISLGDDASQHRGILAEYSTPFIDKMISALASMTVMSYALYTIDGNVVRKLGTDALLITVPLVLFGVFRYLYLVHRHQLGGSPTQVVLTDRGVQVIVGLYLVLVVVLIYYQVQLGLIPRGPLP
jgi:4-hydroxybenzoate polyprenyltransferase